jgi:23S rRNA (cytidine1920-2'-O)/16S rRNA (cytidine1409-2'-O)-methyltransferase
LGRRRPRLRRLDAELARRHPGLADPARAIADGEVLVGGLVARNPATLVRADASIALVRRRPLKGETKLRAALQWFAVPVAGRIALDLGASAGGFTRALLDAGAARVYAVDAGHGQLLGSLRADERVVDLERTNVGELTTELVPERVDLVTMDLSYLSIARALPQLRRISLAGGAALVALVKPQFELGLAAPPPGAEGLRQALDSAIRGVEAAGWSVRGSRPSPVRGAAGSAECFVYAVRAAGSSRRR